MSATLANFLSILMWDFRLQFRYYFWVTGIVVSLVWLMLLFAIVEERSLFWIPVVIFADIGNIGLLFIAGILYLERRQGTIYVAAIMPVSSGTWLSAKLLSLAALCTACSLIIIYFKAQQVDWFRVIPAVALSGALFTSIGFLLAVPFDRIMNYFLGMALALAVLNVPVLGYLEIFDHPLLWLLPSQPAMKLLEASFRDSTSVSFYSTAILLLGWILLLHWLGIRSFRNLVSQREQV